MPLLLSYLKYITMILHNDITHTRQHFVGSFISGVLGAVSQDSANKAQLRATRETNEMNYKIHKEDQQHAIDMWNMENAYNSPAAQRQRLEEAGYNPYSLFEGGGSTAGNVGLPSSPQMQTPPAEAFQSPMLAGLQQAFQAYQMLSNIAIQKGQLNINGRVADADIENKGATTGKIIEETKGIKIGNKYLDDYKAEELRGIVEQNNHNHLMNPIQRDLAVATKCMTIAQTTNLFLDAQAKEEINKWIPVEKALECKQQIAAIQLSYKVGAKTEAETRKTIADTILTYAKTAETKANTTLINKNAQLVDERIETENLNQQGIETDNKQKALDYKNAEAIADSYIEATKAVNALETSRSQFEKKKVDVKSNAWDRERGRYPGLYEYLDDADVALDGLAPVGRLWDSTISTIGDALTLGIFN